MVVLDLSLMMPAGDFCNALSRPRISPLHVCSRSVELCHSPILRVVYLGDILMEVSCALTKENIIHRRTGFRSQRVKTI